MNPRILGAGAVLALLAALVAGCSKSPTAPGASQSLDQAQVSAVLTTSASLVDDGIEENTSQISAAPASEPTKGFVTEAAIKPFTWWQDVTQVSRSWSFAFADTDSTGHPTLCTAMLTKRMTGQFVVVPVSPTDSTQPSTQPIRKPLDKTLTRLVQLKRLDLGGQEVWRVVALTGGSMATTGATTHIVSLRIQSASGVDTTITDPLQFFPLRQVIAFGPEDTVTVTLRTTRNDDPSFIHRWDWRHRLHNNLDGTYSYTWVTSAWGGWRHFALQAMSHGSLYDDTEPYDSEAWHMPFRVIGYQAPVDYYP